MNALSVPRLFVLLSAWGLFLGFAVGAHAQTSQPGPGDQPKPAGIAPAAPDPFRINMLIRTTLVALSQANRTGNYTVLRDLGSPAFQAGNSAAKLGEVFAELRRRKLDFSPVVFFDPKLVRKPAFDSAGRLRLTGFIETRPEQINFDMMFEHVGGDWRLFGLAVQMQPAPAATAATGRDSAPAAKKKAADKKTSAPAKK